MTQGGGPLAATLHASCVLVGEAGILIRGPSGAGKSTLAIALVEAARATGTHAAHVADDRVRVVAYHGRLIARPVAVIAGLLEVRGLGIVRTGDPAPAAVLRRVVDLESAAPPRLPPPDELQADILGVNLPRIPATRADALMLTLWRIRVRDDTPVTGW